MKYTLLALLVISPFAVHANEGHALLAAMEPAARMEALGKLLTRSGYPCAVSRVFFQGFDSDNAAYWNASCKDGNAFSVQIADDADGNTRIMDCAVLKAIGVRCFSKFE